MGKYATHKKEFIKGYIDGKWKSLPQFALAKGIHPNNGGFKKDTVGWRKEAQDKLNRIANEADERAINKAAEKKAVEYLGVYENLGAAAMIASRVVKRFFEEAEEREDIDAREFKAAVDAGIQTQVLLKKIYVGDDLPISADMKHKIEEARQIKKQEESGERHDPTEGMTREEIQEEIAKLQQ